MGYSILMISNPLSHTEKKNLDKSNPYKFAELFYNISEKNSLEKLNEFNKICKGFLIGSGQLQNVGLSKPYQQMYFLGLLTMNAKKFLMEYLMESHIKEHKKKRK